ncbi:contractile injection system tape measure protein [Rhizobium leguminosarum]
MSADPSHTVIRAGPAVQHHVIRRQIVEVKLPGSEADGFALQRRVAGLCRDWLGPALEETLDRIAPSDEYWSIDSLVIDAGSFSAETFERDFVGAVTEALRREIDDQAAGRGGGLQRSEAANRGWSRSTADGADAAGGIERRTGAQFLNRAFLHFLATGTLPWWFRLSNGQSLEEAMTASWNGIAPMAGTGRALLAAITSSVMRTRLVRQFSPSFLNALLRSAAPDAVALVCNLLAEMQRLSVPADMVRQFGEQLWQVFALEAAAGRGPAATEAVTEWVHGALTETGPLQLPAPVVRSLRAAMGLRTRSDETPALAIAPRPMRDPTGEAGASLELEEGIFVECAGLILLHPFLPRLFEALDIAVDGALVQPGRALCLLHFLAAGERRPPEYALVLPKLLCNLPLEEPTDAPVELTAAEEDECRALLEAVIGHWGALGDTSVDALRGTFLVRPGKLSRRGDDTLLQVDTLDFDVLLGQLPWSLSVVRLPWMNRSLLVEWTS